MMLFLSAWFIIWLVIMCSISLELAPEIAPILTIIFRKSLETGEVPPDWRSANVSPVYKKGDRHKAENYRPISLICWDLTSVIV
jgi:hypothetical protein